jgi:spore coat protein CotH
VNRFLANDEFAALYDAAVVELTEELFDSGAFEDTVASWSQVLVQGASDIVDAATIQAEADVLLSYVVPTL